MKTTIPPIPTHPPILTRRAMLLETYGPGPRPCVDAAGNWLGCPGCTLSCILEPGHQLDKAERERRAAETLAALRLEKRQRSALTVKPRQMSTKHEAQLLYEAVASVPATDLLPLSMLCGVCRIAMRPRGERLVCPQCGGWKVAS